MAIGWVLTGCFFSMLYTPLVHCTRITSGMVLASGISKAVVKAQSIRAALSLITIANSFKGTLPGFQTARPASRSVGACSTNQNAGSPRLFHTF